MDAYNVYKESVGGLAWNGDKMKEFDEMPDKQKNAWRAVESYYTSSMIRMETNVYEPFEELSKEPFNLEK